MRWINFSIALLLTVSLAYLGSRHHPFGAAVPPVGRLLSPFTGFWQNAERDAAPGSRQFAFPELSAGVEVVVDERRVPHIFAQTPEDACFVQGYLHARDRLWQMDISVREASGRLSEVLGPVTLERDLRQRRKGMVTAARRNLEAWRQSPRDMALVEAYSRGINAYLAQLSPVDYPLEFKLLDYAPEPWSPLHTAIFLQKMSETLCYRHTDLEATNTLQLLGRESFDFLFPEYNPKDRPVIPRTVSWDFDTLAVTPAVGPVMIGQTTPHRSWPQAPEFVGSNNWAVSGAKTASGFPILCGDPHLGLTLPSVWYEIQLHTPEFNAYGVSFPGAPGIPIGFNEHAAWTETNVGQDVVDWYRITWLDEGKTRYLLDDEVREVSVVEERIEVRGADAVVEKVKYTDWGPVVYEKDGAPYHDLAMQWVAARPREARDHYEIGAFYGLMKSRNYDDYRQALQYYDAPAQNFAFASREGDIALTVNGSLPLKRREQGRFIQDGSYSGNAWQGFIPRGQVPSIRNPEHGYVASANQHSTGPEYPYYYNGGFEDYRGRYINRVLDSLERITPEDMQRLQLDTYSLKAEEGLPLLLGLLDTAALSAEERSFLPMLRAWDYRYPATSRQAVLFEEWFAQAGRSTFDELYALLDSVGVLIPESWRFIELLTDETEHPVFDLATTPETEAAPQIVTTAYQQVIAQFGEQLLDSDYGWALHQKAALPHLGRIPAFSIEQLNAGGTPDAPNALRGSTGPSWRMIVELGDEIKAWGIYPGGPSGNPGSPFFDNGVENWREGTYFELFFMKNADDDRQPRLGRWSFQKN